MAKLTKKNTDDLLKSFQNSLRIFFEEASASIEAWLDEDTDGVPVLKAKSPTEQIVWNPYAQMYYYEREGVSFRGVGKTISLAMAAWCKRSNK